ncbi:hypothetical protein D3C85_238110 [compost metagenome]
MPAKRIAGMARSYRYLQADRRNCPQFAARQRGVWTTGDLLQVPTSRQTRLLPLYRATTTGISCGPGEFDRAHIISPRMV